MTEHSSRPRATVRHALWLGGLLVVLAGLLGMHGLDNHGAAAMNGHGASAMGTVDQPHAETAAMHHTPAPGMADVNADEGRHGVAHDAAALTAAFTDALWSATGGTGTGMNTATMCMAILALGLFALLLHLRTRRSPRPLFVVTRPSPALRTPGRDRDPPCLFVLSVHRC